MSTKTIDAITASGYFVRLNGVFVDRENPNAVEDTINFRIGVSDSFRYFNEMFGGQIVFDINRS